MQLKKLEIPYHLSLQGDVMDLFFKPKEIQISKYNRMHNLKRYSVVLHLYSSMYNFKTQIITIEEVIKIYIQNWNK